MYVCIVILFFVGKCECKDYIYIYIYKCECKKIWNKWMWYLFSPSHTRIQVPKVYLLSYFLGCFWSPAAAFLLSLFPLSLFFLLPPYTATSLPSFLTKNSSFFEEEIRQLTLRFYLQSVWVSKLNLIWFCVFG